MVKKVKNFKKSLKADIRTRPPLARMMRVHESLQQETFPNCRSLG